MIGILIVTHGDFGHAVKESSELITGTIQNCQSIALNRDDDILDLKNKVDIAVEELNQGEGVIVLVDLIGGSPFNICSLVLKEKRNFKLLSGVNLPILIECSMMRESMNLDELTQYCKTIGQSSVIEVTP